MATFQSLWLQLEPLVLKQHKVTARAILAAAWKYDEERDAPPPSPYVRGSRTKSDEGANHLPSQEEIRERCAELQSTWSDTERLKRTVGPTPLPGEYEIPTTAPIYTGSVLPVKQEDK